MVSRASAIPMQATRSVLTQRGKRAEPSAEPLLIRAFAPMASDAVALIMINPYFT